MQRNAAKLLLGGLFVVCVFRAITQSIVYDEAETYELYITAPFSAIFTYFDANHHFFSTLLIRLSTALFGISEWSMRLPALAGALLYFTAVYRLARAAFGEGRTFLLAVAALSLNPFILDFMVAARGYGPALALWMWALMLLYSAFSAPEIPPKDLAMAGAFSRYRMPPSG
jgi:4-amino-4-deoxy-L-arabinose transferase-like glycosyltransferase